MESVYVHSELEIYYGNFAKEFFMDPESYNEMNRWNKANGYAVVFQNGTVINMSDPKRFFSLTLDKQKKSIISLQSLFITQLGTHFVLIKACEGGKAVVIRIKITVLPKEKPKFDMPLSLVQNVKNNESTTISFPIANQIKN